MPDFADHRIGRTTRAAASSLLAQPADASTVSASRPGTITTPAFEFSIRTLFMKWPAKRAWRARSLAEMSTPLAQRALTMHHSHGYLVDLWTSSRTVRMPFNAVRICQRRFRSRQRDKIQR